MIIVARHGDAVGRRQRPDERNWRTSTITDTSISQFTLGT